MYICLCRVVTRTTVETAIAQGARTVEEVGQRCAAGTDGCKCHRTIQKMLNIYFSSEDEAFIAEVPELPAHLRKTSEPTRGG